MQLAHRVRQLAGLSPADVRERLTFARIDECLRVRHAMTKRRESFDREFVVHPKELDRNGITVRVGTSDPAVVWDTFVGKYHLPPAIVPADAARIWDLGSNIGLTVAHYAVLYPDARITGVELDSVTADRADANIRPWADRCSIVRGAVWFEEGEITYSTTHGGEHGAHVGAGDRTAPAHSLNALFADDEWIDFVKMDIEGAESEVLTRNTEWMSKVGAFKIEVHREYTRDMCCNDLRSAGFDARPDPVHWAGVVATRAR